VTGISPTSIKLSHHIGVLKLEGEDRLPDLYKVSAVSLAREQSHWGVRVWAHDLTPNVSAPIKLLLDQCDPFAADVAERMNAAERAKQSNPSRAGSACSSLPWRRRSYSIRSPHISCAIWSTRSPKAIITLWLSPKDASALRA